MAGPANPGSEPVLFANPLISPPSLLAPDSTRPADSTRFDPHLRSIASLHSRSPIPVRGKLPTPRMATTTSAERPQETGRDHLNTHSTNLQTAREALGAVMGVVSNDHSSDRTDGSTPATSIDSGSKSIHSNVDNTKSDGRQHNPSPGASDGFGTGDANGGPIMNRAPVASPGPIEESHPAEAGEDPPRREDESMLEDGNKSFSYPVPAAASNINDPRRGMSLPHSGFNKASPRSPSAKKHRCPYCSTEFTRHHNLKSHLLTHSQEKPYVCQTCQSRFRRLHDLKRHTKLHTGERPHICHKCGRRFARGDALARHNKGQGGCAGRRSSLGGYLGEDDYGDGSGAHGAGADDSMQGLMYTEPERMDEEEERRANEMPRIRRHNAPDSLPHKQPYQHQPSTYPPLAANNNNRPPPPQGGLFPPQPHHRGSSSSTSPISQSGNPSFPPPGGPGPGSSSSSYNTSGGGHRGSSPSLFAQTNMTESPKPLSPNAMSTHQLGHGPEGHGLAHQHLSRGHSPGRTQPQSTLQPQSMGRDSISVTSGGSRISLPPAQGLPNPATTSTSPLFPQQHEHARQLSTSSQGGPASAGTGPPPPLAPVDGIWRHVRALENRINGLEEEVVRLRGQLATAGGGGSGVVTNGT